jgi:hypothetical protein
MANVGPVKVSFTKLYSAQSIIGDQPTSCPVESYF